MTSAAVAEFNRHVMLAKDAVTPADIYAPFSGQFRRQCMQFRKSAGNFGGSAFRRPLGHDSAGGLSKLFALLPNYMPIIHNWSEKVYGAV